MFSYVYVLRSIPSSPQADMMATQGTGAGVGGGEGGGRGLRNKHHEQGLCIKVVGDALRYHSTGVRTVTEWGGDGEGGGDGGQGKGGKKKEGGGGGGKGDMSMTFGQCRGGGEAVAEMGLCCLRSLFRNGLEAEEVARGTEDLQLVLQVVFDKLCQK
jgi:hypothetical protein